MKVELNQEEATALRELLDRHVGDMYAEISHTDNPSYRASLRGERDVLRAIRDKLSA